MRMLKISLLALALAVTPLAPGTPALAFTPPEGHEKFMEEGTYKAQFEAFSAMIDEARLNLTDEEYQALEKKTGELLETDFKANMEFGSSEAEAWTMAYIVGTGSIGQELVFDHLRKNPVGVQGYYKLENEDFDGYMTVTEVDKSGAYDIYIFAIQNYGSFNSGEISGHGSLAGGKIPVEYGQDDPEATVDIIFNGDKAQVVTSQAFMASGWLGLGVILDGKYSREKKQVE